ncbi:MAG: S-layer homology domain-containing protein [Flavonifractor plautii]
MSSPVTGTAALPTPPAPLRRQIDRLATYGILAGTGGGAFQPEGSLTRAQPAPCWPRPSTAGFPPARAGLTTYPWTTGTACASTPWPGWAWWRAWERAASPPTRQ